MNWYVIIQAIGEPFLFLAMTSGAIGIGTTCTHLFRRLSGLYRVFVCCLLRTPHRFDLAAASLKLVLHAPFEGGRDLAKETKNSIVLALSGLIVSLLSIVQLSSVVFLGSLECRYDPKDAPEKVSPCHPFPLVTLAVSSRPFHSLSQDCIVTFVYLGVSIALVVLQSVCFQKLLNKTGVVSRMLNPVSSGMVSLA